MAGLTDKGLVIKNSQEILNSLNDRAKQAYGYNFDTTPYSVMGILNNINTGEYIDLWEALQAVHDSFNKDKAEGKSLDDLAALIGISRLQQSYSNGELIFETTEGTNISAGYAVKQETSDNFVQVVTFFKSTITKCYGANFQISNLLANSNYTIQVLDNVYIYNSTPLDDELSILTALADAINTEGIYLATIVDNTLSIINSTTDNILSFNKSSNLSLYSVLTKSLALAYDLGSVIFPSNTLIKPVTPISGLISVNNPSDFIVGRERETDEELRVRMGRSVQITGTATKPSIESTLLNINGVTAAVIIENRSMIPDEKGRPAKSYECYVQGGVEDVIAEKIWLTKPAGVEVVGDIEVVIVDFQGKPHVMYFSRPKNIRVYVKVAYAVYTEEVFPSNGEDLILASILETSNELTLDQDVIPQRFVGNVYRNVSGIGDLSITMSTDGVNYSTDKIAISQTEQGIISSNDIEITFTGGMF